MPDRIWVFCGENGLFPSGVFSSKERAEEWILTNHLTGTLTAYPVDVGVYEWAIQHEYFKPKEDKHRTSNFIQQFTSASQEHYHYQDGKV